MGQMPIDKIPLLTPQNLWGAWSFEPSIVTLLGLTILIYLWGVRNARRRAGAGRAWPAWRWMCFAGAVLSLILALLSPLDALSSALFSAHMTQHLILMMVTAPLLVLSDLPVAIIWALPRTWAKGLGHGLNRSVAFSRAWQALLSPVSAWLLFALPMWIWHASTIYEAALRNETIHTFEHLTFILTGMLFWWVLFRRTTADHVHYGMAVLYLFGTMLQSTVLGALMTFTTRAWYMYYAPLVGRWGMTPLQDQQLAGIIMWLPGGVVFTVLTIAYFAAWLRALERRSIRLQQRNDIPAHNEPL